ncbi:transporter substrate-binding domain-containing protein [Skermania piniformis]|uniref:Transporter substrate-binding domain-containing protein n=2 Tax=Skermania pinensis TaxID=39122 RepID=A0ABX8SFJ7_9ACTN|nr:ABC transporter substrate-binding protein [Skermania piniformis]QXQ15942.1 transporter substrate-binding domain-containing protein [Skermania piniformis]
MLALAGSLAAACAADPAPPAESSSTSDPAGRITSQMNCGPDSGKSVHPGVLTIATDDPAYPPWFVDNDPGNGRGFEGAVAQAVWERLGYNRDQVAFVKVPFTSALEPGPKDFDFDINQVTIEHSRRAAIDFSAPYYQVAQAVVALSGSPAARATTLAELGGFRLGAADNSTSLSAVTDTIHPAAAIPFPTTDDAKAALIDGRIDALVVDIPTGFQIAGHDIPNSVLVGQFPRPNDVSEFFGLVLQKDSRLTECVSAALESLYQDGTLDRFAKSWLADTTGVRVLE